MKRHERLLILTLAWLAIELVLIIWNNPLVERRLATEADHLRFAHALDFTEGQDWYDQTLPRFEQPIAAEVHLTRLAELPLLAFFAPLLPFTGRTPAALIAAGITSAIALAGAALAAVYAARALAPRLGAVFALVTLAANPDFLSALGPGRIDGAGWQIVFLLAQFGAVLRIARHPKVTATAPILAAITVALALWNSPEQWLVDLLPAGLLILLWIRRGAAVWSNSFIFSMTLSLCGLLSLPLTLPVAEWGSVNLQTYSAFHALSGVAFALFFLIGGILGFWLKTAWGRAWFLISLGLIIVLPFYAKFPDPVDIEAFFLLLDRDTMLANTEQVFALHALPLSLLSLASGISLIQILRRQRKHRDPWVLHFIASLFGLVFLSVGAGPDSSISTLAVPAVTWLLSRTVRRISSVGQSPALQRVLAVTFALGLTGISVFFQIFPISSDGTALAAKEATSACHIDTIVETLNGGPIVRADTRLFYAPIDLGAELLFRTHHRLISAVLLNSEDGTDYLDQSVAAARAATAWHGVDYLLLCDHDRAGRITLSRPGSFGSAVRNGELPAWLIAVDTGITAPLRLYRIQLSASGN